MQRGGAPPGGEGGGGPPGGAPAPGRLGRVGGGPRGPPTPLSGPAAAWGSTARGMEAWAAHVNEQGGVHGRKIKMVLKDDGYVPGRAVANVTEMKDSVFAIVGLLGTAIVGAAQDVAINAKT